MDVAKCEACQELFNVTGDSDFRHQEVGLGGLRDQRSINLCPPCRRKAQELAAAPAEQENKPDADAPSD